MNFRIVLLVMSGCILAEANNWGNPGLGGANQAQGNTPSDVQVILPGVPGPEIQDITEEKQSSAVINPVQDLLEAILLVLQDIAAQRSHMKLPDDLIE